MPPGPDYLFDLGFSGLLLQDRDFPKAWARISIRESRNGKFLFPVTPGARYRPGAVTGIFSGREACYVRFNSLPDTGVRLPAGPPIFRLVVQPVRTSL